MSSMGTGLRCFVASLAILSLAGHLSAVPLAAGVSCQNNNPFIKIMKDQGVELYSQPKQVPKICGDEFEQYGTCCNLTEATRYALDDRRVILTAAANIAREFAEFSTIPKQLLKQLATIASIPTIEKGDKMAKINYVIEDAKELLQRRKFRHYFKRVAEKIRFNSEQFLRASNQCWNRLANLRSSSVCSTCSGRSERFFKDGMVLIEHQVCNSIVQDCVSYIEILVNFIEALEDLPKILEQSISSGLEINLREKLNLAAVDKFFKSFVSNNILALVGLNKGHKSGDTHSGLLLCQYMLRLKYPVLVVELQAIFANAGSWKISLDPDVSTYLSQVKSSVTKKIESEIANFESSLVSDGVVATNWSVGQARLLQGNPKSQSVHDTHAETEAMMFIDWNDPSYTSVGVSGSGPMRFDLAFP